jgi:RNA polymerase sigma factor (sigma-70 family)
MKPQKKFADERTAEANASRDEELGALYRQYSAWLVRLLRRRFGRERAEDLAQDTFLKIVASKAPPPRHPRGYLAYIAANAARDDHRRRMSRGGESDLPLDDLDQEPSYRSEQEQAALLKEIILSMPVRQRETFLLSRIAGMTFPQIAAKQGISLKTVEARMSKALAHCVAKLRD